MNVRLDDNCNCHWPRVVAIEPQTLFHRLAHALGFQITLCLNCLHTHMLWHGASDSTAWRITHTS